jgi:ATP-dependent helicase HrpB
VDRVALPVDPFLPAIADALRRTRALVVSAPPGAGKTTRIPPALAPDGPVIVLQPRRVAARSIARRIAAEQGWTLGGRGTGAPGETFDVGWHVRFERNFGHRTRVLVATEGILTARLQQDPLLSDFRTVVLDEFHERSIHADLGLALARQAWIANPELRLVVMSATLDTARVSAFLAGCSIIEVPGRVHPIDLRYAPGRALPEAAIEMLGASSGQVLCFLPGAPEIRRALGEVQARAPAGVDVVPLHGSLDAAEQDEAIRPVERRRVILATNIAETSLTVPGVTAVVDTGLHKIARYDPDRAIDSLETERITADAAEQRAGRAGRLAPGVVCRLWDARDRLRPHREPEVARVDLAATVLDVIAWGGDPRTFAWFEAPPDGAVDAALALLERLGAIETGLKPRSTALGDRLRRLPLHPRLGRILIESGGSHETAAACALIAERHFVARRNEAAASSTTSDLLSAVDRWNEMPPHLRNVADEIVRGLAGSRSASQRFDEAAFRRAILSGYPDRVGRRRAPGSPRILLSSGHGAVIAPESGVRDAEFIVAIDVTAGRRGEGSEARIRVASGVEREWLAPTASDTVHQLDETTGVVRATRIDRYGAIVLTERRAPVDADEAARMLAEAYLARGLDERDAQLARRLRFAGQAADLAALARAAASRARRLADIDLETEIPPDIRRALDRLAPETLAIPSGRSVRLDYRDDGSVAAAVKLQELFGLGETPRLGARREPVVFELLAPNGRPVQVTRDLRSFWERTYPEIRKALRARYPKHPWPDDPWTATPTRRTIRLRDRQK